MTVSTWDYYYLSSDTSGGLQPTVVTTQTGPPVLTTTGDSGIQVYDTATSGNSSVLGDTPNDTFTDDDGNQDTYLGQATITTDTGTATAFFGTANVAGEDVIIVYVPPGSFTDQSDFISKNSGATISSAAYTLPCFIAGTMLRTPSGERAVEDLRAGDLVLTANGAAKPVQWLGRSTKATMFADPARSLPVRILAGALGDNLPTRDLLVSPGHAMLVDGLLVQAGAMVNGTTIVRETKMPATFTYYHVDTGAHDLLVAEGAPTESFLAGVEDMGFDNWADRPATAGVPAEMAYPRVKAARQLPASVRDLIAARVAVVMPAVALAA